MRGKAMWILFMVYGFECNHNQIKSAILHGQVSQLYSKMNKETYGQDSSSITCIAGIP